MKDLADELWLGDLQVYPFALLGVLLGYLYVALGAWVVPLFIAPIFMERLPSYGLHGSSHRRR